MAVPCLKQSTRLAEKQEKQKKEETVRLQLQSEPAQPSKGKGQGNFYFMINHILLALLVLFLLDVYYNQLFCFRARGAVQTQTCTLK